MASEESKETEVQSSGKAKTKASKDDVPPRDPIMQELCLRLECSNTNCANICASPIQMCRNGHLICRSCCLDIKKAKPCNCPKCGVDIRHTYHNRALAAVAEAVVVPCSACDIRCRHSDLKKHLDYCRLKRAGKKIPKNSPVDWKYRPGVDDVEPSDAGKRAMTLLEQAITCNFCGEVATPMVQCHGGHVICSACLDNLRTQVGGGAALPTCPFDQADMRELAKNQHVEEMAAYLTVKCRFPECEKELHYEDLAQHLIACDYQPIVCIECVDAGKDATHDANYQSWDEVWEHYKEVHRVGTPTKVSELVLKHSLIREITSNNKLKYICWGHCINDDGEGIRIFPGLFYYKQRKTFYLSIRVMAPVDRESLFAVVVKAETSPMELSMKLPAISYRVTHEKTAFSPGLAISLATMKLLTEGGGGLKISIELPKNGPRLT